VTPRHAPSAEHYAVETHVSVLFFSGDRVYKLRKPVKFGFLDFSSREAREADCHREVELNRRYAPDVYLGVYDLVDEGQPIDHLVVMKRLPEERRLATLSSEHKVGPADLADVVRVFLSSEESAAHTAEIDAAAGGEALRAAWRSNEEELTPFVGPIIDRAADERVLELAHSYLLGRERLLEARIGDRRARDGHGDLRPDDIFMLADGPRILDCIEFDDRLRYGDVLADIGFLAMELECLGAPELSRSAFQSYAELSGDSFPPSLANYYCAARAYVRAKVSCLAAAEHLPGAVEEARALHELARSFLERTRVQLVLIGGLPGTGKSTLATALGGAIPAEVLRSDEVRHRLAGNTVPVDVLYGGAMTRATYGQMLDLAREALELGSSVILDASWTDEAWRKRARLVARGTRSELVELRCEAPRALAESRITERLRRGGDASDATVEVARAMSAGADPWPGSVAVDTSVAEEVALAAALAALGKHPVSGAFAVPVGWDGFGRQGWVR
jgi:uncharacterized protein